LQNHSFDISVEGSISMNQVKKKTSKWTDSCSKRLGIMTVAPVSTQSMMDIGYYWQCVEHGLLFGHLIHTNPKRSIGQFHVTETNKTTGGDVILTSD
jgi:hypothetical protein